MTCSEAARLLEAPVLRRAGRPGRTSMRDKQAWRIAQRLRRHGGEHRFSDDVRGTLATLGTLPLLLVEMAVLEWWPEERARTFAPDTP